MSTFAPMPAEAETARLRLRAWTAADAEAVRELWAERDPRSSRRIDADGHPTVAELRTSIETRERESARTGLRLWALERRDQPGFLGYCGLVAEAATHDEPEIAFELVSDAQGQGYATEAARAAVAAARASGRSRLWASVRAWNDASFRVLAKLEFLDSGRVTPDPARGDLVWMTLALPRPRGAGRP